MLRLHLRTLIVLALCAAGSPARADRVTDLCRVVDRGGDLRVQVRALVALEEMKSPRAVKSLASALDRSFPMVRLLAARALGKLGNASALAAMERRLKLETDPGVKAWLSSGIEDTRRMLAGPPAGTRYDVTVGAVNNGSGKGDPELPIVMGEVMARGLDKLPGWWVRPPLWKGRAEAGGPRQLVIRAKVQELNRDQGEGGITYSCLLLVSIHQPDGGKVVPTLEVATNIVTTADGHREAHFPHTLCDPELLGCQPAGLDHLTGWV